MHQPRVGRIFEGCRWITIVLVGTAVLACGGHSDRSSPDGGGGGSGGAAGNAGRSGSGGQSGGGGQSGSGGQSGGAGRGGNAGQGGQSGAGGACACMTGCCRSDSSCGTRVGNLLGPCVQVVSGTPDSNCPSWNGGETVLPGCCLADGTCGISIGGTSCFAASEVGLSPKPCP